MQDFIEFKYWPLLLKASWQAAVIILLVLTAQRALGRRLTPRWRCGLWLLVALRLALPWTLPSSVSLFNILNFSRASEAVVSGPSNPEELGPPMLEPIVAVQPAAPTAAYAPAFKFRLSWLPLVWAAGALALAFYMVAAHFRLARRVTLCRPLIDASVMNLLENCKQRMRVRVPVTLVETAVVDGPCLFGVVRPRLLLPTGFTRRFTPDELRYVFLHELGHVKRHDIPLGWLMAALQILHWFNPLVWLAFSRMRADRELACDALALSHAEEQDNKPYGLTIVKLLESFGKSVRAPSLAGIVENKQQMKERIRMIAQYPRSKGGFVLAATVLAGLAVLTLTDCTTSSEKPKATPPVASTPPQQEQPKQESLPPQKAIGSYEQQQLEMAQAGNKWGAYRLWDGYYRGNHGIQPDSAKADKWLREFVQNVWVVRFEPIDDFKPSTPGEFLERVNAYAHSSSGQNDLGTGSFFRTTKQGGKLVGSFLCSYPDQLKAALANVPGLKVTSVEKMTPEQFIPYEQSKQESLMDFNHLDASQGVWVVRFEPVDDFSPKTPGEFLARIPVYSGQHGEIGYFRTTKQGDKLLGSFLASDGDQLKAALDALPGIKVTSVEKLTQEQLDAYEKLPQESLIDFNHLDASKGVWVVRFEPVDDFSPKTPGEFLARIPVYSDQHGEIGYFRTTKQGDKLAGSFLAYDPDQLKAALAALPGIKVTSVEKLTQEQLDAYEKSPQESLNAEGGNGSYEQQQQRDIAQMGNNWGAYNLWDACTRGSHGINPDPAKAQKWLQAFVQDAWLVRFEPVDAYSPSTAKEFLEHINHDAFPDWNQVKYGTSGFFRTKQQGDKLLGSFLTVYPDDLKARLAKVPGIKVTSVAQMTPEKFITYEKSEQEDLISLESGLSRFEQQQMKRSEAGNKWAAYNLWDAYSRGNNGIKPDPTKAEKWLQQFVQGLWVVRFEPVGTFAPATPMEFLQKIWHYAHTDVENQNKPGQSGFFRTSRQGDKLVGSFLSFYPDDLKSGLAKVPGLKITSVEQMTAEQFITYEQTKQESL